MLPNFKSARVLVVGDIMLDRYWHGQTGRISPEAPVPVVNVEHIEERPGGAANVAMNIASLGAVSKIIGLTGADEAAEILVTKLNKEGVQCHLIQVPSHTTITKLRILSRHQQLIRLDFEKNFDGAATQDIYEAVFAVLPDINVLVLSDYAKGTLHGVQNLIQCAKNLKIPVLIDPKGNNFERYRNATLLTPNLAEFEAIVGKCHSEEDIIERGKRLLQRYEFSALLVTRSENGMTLLQFDKPPLHFLAQSQDVYDVTGAGDTVIGVLAAALSTGSDLETAAFLANTAAGIVVSKSGTSTVTFIELKKAIQVNVVKNTPVVSEGELKEIIHLARQRGRKIVMTNGCFDLLHAGHIAYLEEAKKLGDYLIVAVNTDASVRRLKGERRPINSLENRMRVLAALGCVDWVISFDEDTPERLVSHLLPDILVKGGDYQIDEIAGGTAVKKNGGEVYVLNFEEGLSTTKTIEKIKKI